MAKPEFGRGVIIVDLQIYAQRRREVEEQNLLKILQQI